MPIRRPIHPLSAVMLVTLAAATATATATGTANADSGRLMPRDAPAAHAQECASCHSAYPPGLLPAASWQRIMSGLDRHYGTDASIDATTVRELSRWLQANAGTYKRVRGAPPDDRITRADWFVRKHRELDAAAWKHPAVRSAANCAACHPGADRGDYDDDGVRLPAGLSATWRARGRD